MSTLRNHKLYNGVYNNGLLKLLENFVSNTNEAMEEYITQTDNFENYNSVSQSQQDLNSELQAN